MSEIVTPEPISDEEVESWFDEEEADALRVEDVELEDPAEKYARSQLRVVRESKDYQLDYLRHAFSTEPPLIKTSPKYQRRLRWPVKKRSLLIESFLLNIPIPPVFLFEHDYNEYEVIDGRQRLESIREFFANEFALTGLAYWEELNRKKFDDLPSVLQKGLLRRSIPAVILLAETKSTNDEDMDVRTLLFDRLNTGGIKLNPQELRNALYPGALNQLLAQLARSRPFTITWGIPAYLDNEETDPSADLLKHSLFKSMADVELVLRYFALRDAIENNRHGSLRQILDRFMKKNQHLDESKLLQMKGEFESLLDRLVRLFDERPFWLPTTKRPSRPLYDALMIALSKNPGVDLEENATQIKTRLQQALSESQTYDTLVGRGNTIESIRDRVRLASYVLDPAWSDK